MITTFCRLHEDCDWEGERWDFWLQVTGNEGELIKLGELLHVTEDAECYELPYQLHLEDVESEPVVDKLVEYAIPGYMDSANKITGTFTCPETLGEGAEALYKGGIAKFFKENDV